MKSPQTFSRRFLQLAALGALASTFAGQVAPVQAVEADDAAGADKPSNKPSNAYVTIHNDFNWTDQNGEKIYTRSGSLSRFDGVWYWYGGRTPSFREQYCYTSTDLVHWTNKGVVYREDKEINRIDVLYNESTKKYVMFMKYDGNGAHFAIATAERPQGPFTFVSKTLVDEARIGDMSMFKDDDGKVYLCYISWATGPNAKHGIYRMSDDYMSLDKRIFLWNRGGREAPHLFKRNGIYYYGTSQTAWIDSSETRYYSAKNLEGPWSPARPLATPGSKNSWDSQVDFIYPIHGSQGTVYMYAGDRWLKDAATGRTGDYVWLPMEFDGETPIVNYRQDWELNVATGTWREFDPARNLAAGKPVVASSAEGPNAAKNVTASKTYRDYVKSQWLSVASDPQWIRVDLGKSTEINRAILKWGASAARAFKIQTSVDGIAWEDVHDASRGMAFGITDQTFPTTLARYVRVYATERAPLPPPNRRRTSGSTTQPAPVSTPEPPKPVGYSLFQFLVLKD